MELIKPQKGTKYNIENDIQNLTNIEQEFEQIDNKITNDISSSINEIKDKVDNDITTAITELDNKVNTEIVTIIDNLETKVNTEIPESITALDNKVTTSLQEQTESLKKEISDQIAKVVANSPEDFDTLKEISDWISSHSEDASAMNSAILSNTAAIKTLDFINAEETVSISSTDIIPIVQDGETKKVYFGNIIPVGTIFPCASNDIPASWLLCNGSTYDIEKYPKLYKILGTNVLPDLRGRFLQGANENLGTEIEAGLPNITGYHHSQGSDSGNEATGAFGIRTKGKVDSGSSTSSHYINSVNFDASRCSSIYGNSDTVQPPAYTVNYIIKAT